MYRNTRRRAGLHCDFATGKIMAPWRFPVAVLLKIIVLLGILTGRSCVLADIGLVTFWVPELHALLLAIQEESGHNNASMETHVYGARRFYTSSSFKGHRVVVVHGGESVSNSAATTAILLQKFPNIDRIVGSGTAGGVVSALLLLSSKV